MGHSNRKRTTRDPAREQPVPNLRLDAHLETGSLLPLTIFHCERVASGDYWRKDAKD